MSEPNQNIHEGGVIPNAEAKARKDEIGRLADDRIRLRDAAEREIVVAIVNLAKKYNAIEEIASLDEITIPNLMAVKARHSVMNEDMNNLMSELSVCQLQLQAVVGGTWQTVWEDFKTRFPSIISDIINEVRGK